MNNRNLVDFFSNEVRSFSIYNCERSIPSAVDGLKPSQRKVLYGMMKKFPTQEVKVSIASAGIMEISSYHHGALDGVITNMASAYAGTNNEPLLEGIGQFGSRISPEPAASRYIFTKLSGNIKRYFKNEDTAILNYLEDDGVYIEPEYYLPVIPMILVNGANGMGTGFACSIASYNPKDITEYITSYIKGNKTKKLIPWSKGFNGVITKEGDQISYIGKLEKINTTTIHITELPIGVYTIKYRETLNKLEDNGYIKSYSDESNEEQIKFVVKVSREIGAQSEDELLKLFKLIKKDTENITVWNDKHKIVKFSSVEDLVEWFVDFRIAKYQDRKDVLLVQLNEKIEWYKEQMRFIKLYLKSGKEWSKLKDKEVVDLLTNEKFIHIDQLLNINIRKLTGESIEDLENKINKLQEELKDLSSKTPTDLYEEELKEL